MKKMLEILGAVLLVLLSAAICAALEGLVHDREANTPIAGAVATLGGQTAVTDADGYFRMAGSGPVLMLRAVGYQRTSVPIKEAAGPRPIFSLDPLHIRGLYLSVYGIGSRVLRKAALTVLKTSNMNALVIDVKGDRGIIPFPIDYPMAAEVGAQKVITVKDMRALLEELRRDNIYLIARIVVFKDNILATARPEWAVRTSSGSPYLDYEQLRWVDPFIAGVWEYNIRVAKIAAELGFDEIQFDYVRFPDRRGLRFSRPATEESRTEAITGFLQEASQALLPYNVFVAADIFGYVLWNIDDTDVGQKIKPILGSVDIVSPMLYPSGFQFGIPGYRNPVANIYPVVRLSLERARKRTDASPLQFRPWLQAFRDYAFGGGMFGEEQVKLQIKAAEDFGSSGWMLWNPRNIYPVLHDMKTPGDERINPPAGGEPTAAIGR